MISRLTKKTRAQPKMVYVEWADAHSEGGWKTKEEAHGWASGSGWWTQQTGWLLDENNNYLLMASLYNPGSGDREPLYGDLLKIPKPWIKKRRNIKV